jgi:TM2 domain-containing membrane protein YozV
VPKEPEEAEVAQEAAGSPGRGGEKPATPKRGKRAAGKGAAAQKEQPKGDVAGKDDRSEETAKNDEAGKDEPSEETAKSDEIHSDDDQADESDEDYADADAEDALYADAPIVSAKVEHDFVPSEDDDTNASETVSAAQETSLVPCSQCQTELEPWQLACHQCGNINLTARAPTVVAEKRDEKSTLESFSDWFKNGSAALEAGNYSDAQISFVEALVRVKGIENGHDREVLVRKQLARALEKQDKRAEASEQYVILSQLTAHTRPEFEKRASELSRSTADMMARILSGVHYRNPESKEARIVPLYCSRCRMLLVEAEVYGFRNGKAGTVRCFCGYEGRPLVRVDAKHLRALKEAPLVQSQRALLLQAAAGILPGTHRKNVAIPLALFLGWCGAHRFYLGERASGINYMLWLFILVCLNGWLWSSEWRELLWLGLVIPWAIAVFDAINYAQMSRVTFNLTYNIERVVAELPLDDKTPAAHTEVFSMEPGEQDDQSDDGFSDEFTVSDYDNAVSHVIPGAPEQTVSVTDCDPA